MKHATQHAAVLLMILGFASFCGGAPPAVSNVTFNMPGVVNYQARLKTESGVDYTNGLYDIEFRLYSGPGAGVARWGGAYKVFVKDGFFGVMLGAAGGTDLTNTTYGAGELWKALWYDESDPVNDLFLGLTVLQGEDNQALPTPTESVPRQQFLCTPFAYRALQAQYARQPHSDFDVGADLRVSADARVDGITRLGRATLPMRGWRMQGDSADRSRSMYPS